MRYVALLAATVVIFVFVCSRCPQEPKSALPTFTKNQVLPTDTDWGYAGVGIALKDMDGDGDIDIVMANSLSVRYFENVGNGNFANHGEIANSGVDMNETIVELAIDDIDGDGILEIVVAAADGIRIIQNPVQQKRKK